jgi:hypothetical protein
MSTNSVRFQNVGIDAEVIEAGEAIDICQDERERR